MNIDSHNFNHLLEIDRPLAVLASHAERYFIDDANTALIKTRQFAERMTYFVAESAGTLQEDGDTFADTLRKIRRDGLLPGEILDVLHHLRIEGNAAVHGHSGKRRLAFEAIKLCHRLGVWLRASVTNKPGLTMPFMPPNLSADDPDELRLQVESLRQKLHEQSLEAAERAEIVQHAKSAVLDAEQRAKLAEEEREIYAPACAINVEVARRVKSTRHFRENMKKSAGRYGLCTDFQGQCFSLLQNRFDGVRCEIRRISMSLKNLLHRNPHFCADILTAPPISSRIPSDCLDQFGGYDLELVVGHDLNGAVVLSERIIERTFIYCQAIVWLCTKVFCNFDQLLNDLQRINATVVVSPYCHLETFRELIFFDDVTSSSRTDFSI